MIKVMKQNTVPMIYDGIGLMILYYATNLDKTDFQIDFVVIHHLEDKIRNQMEPIGSKIFELTERNSSQLKDVKALAKVVRDGIMTWFTFTATVVRQWLIY